MSLSRASLASGVGVAVLLAGCASLRPAVAVPTAMAAHEICSAVFISGLSPDRVVEATVAPQLGAAALLLLRRDVDPRAKAVRASLGGLAGRRAVYRGELGCIVEPRDSRLATSTAAPAPALSPVKTLASNVSHDTGLEAALDVAFQEPLKGPRRRTYAAVIVHDGRIVAERYAAGISPETPLHGWSMGKSVTNALLGVLVEKGRLDMAASAPVPEWRDAKDPRHAITPDDLLRMRSGLDVGQSLTSRWNAPFDPANQIMFAAPNMAAAAASRRLKTAPKTTWQYSDGNTAILGRLVRDLGGGGDPVATQAFVRRELFDRLGMGPVTLETDASGSPIGATQFYASARDWARLGQLFLDDGRVGDQRILPRGWVAYSTRLTPGSDAFGYGAGFWVSHPHPSSSGMPAGSFMARGARGQYVVVAPSAHLVIVKLGDADTPRGDIEAMTRMVGLTVRWAEARKAERTASARFPRLR